MDAASVTKPLVRALILASSFFWILRTGNCQGTSFSLLDLGVNCFLLNPAIVAIPILVSRDPLLPVLPL